MQDEASQPQPLSAAYGAPRGGSRGGVAQQPQFNVQMEIMWIKQDAAQVRNAVLLLEQEKDSLRKAIRKLKLENGRIKEKVKTLQKTVAELRGDSAEDALNGATEADLDYDDIGRDFMLVGGVHDPLSLRFEVLIRDAQGIEHKSAERYYWYKIAETFGDVEAMKKIRDAANVANAEMAMKEIKGFEEKIWNTRKAQVWEEGQRMKLAQARWITNLLVLSDVTYIAVASQDKFFGTGWRKNREEANKPIFWDGENQGGKVLMKIRQQLKETHKWAGPYEEEETQKKFKDLRRFVWRRIDPTKRLVGGGPRGYPTRTPRGAPRVNVGRSPQRQPTVNLTGARGAPGGYGAPSRT